MEFEVIRPKCAGLDVHKKSVAVWPVRLCCAAYCAGFRQQTFQSVALGEKGTVNAAGSIIDVLYTL